MIGVLFLCLIAARNSFSQIVTWTVETAVPRYGEPLKLACAVSADCCNSSFRIWEDAAGTQILNDGVSSDPDKYEEEWDGGTTGFNLIIKKLQLTDVNLDYDCRYKFGNQKKKLNHAATWEYAPVERCPATIKFMQGLLINSLHVERSAPKPTFYARNQVNVTSLLMEKDVRNFETWFFSLTVYMEKKVTCENDDRFTLEAVTGTTTTKICDSVNLCACLKCFGYCVAFSSILTFIASVFYIAALFKQGQISFKKGCLAISAYVCLRVVMEYLFFTTLFNVLPSYLVGWFDCPCKTKWTWVFISFLSCATGLIASWITPCQIYDWIYLWDIFSKKSPFKKFGICCLGIISGGIAFFIFSAFDKKWFRGTGSKEDSDTGLKEDPYKVYVKQECEAVLECKDKDVKKKWDKKDDKGWKAIAPLNKYKILDTPACCKNMYHRLHIMDSQPIDEGTYRCVGEANKEYHFQLILRNDDASYFKRWIYFGMIMVSTLFIIPVIVLIICFECLKANSGKDRKRDAELNGADAAEML